MCSLAYLVTRNSMSGPSSSQYVTSTQIHAKNLLVMFSIASSCGVIKRLLNLLDSDLVRRLGGPLGRVCVRPLPRLGSVIAVLRRFGGRFSRPYHQQKCERSTESPLRRCGSKFTFVRRLSSTSCLEFDATSPCCLQRCLSSGRSESATLFQLGQLFRVIRI